MGNIIQSFIPSVREVLRQGTMQSALGRKGLKGRVSWDIGQEALSS